MPTFDDFLFDLRAFESGWDRPRYDSGIIADWQLDQWAGGIVQDFFPQYDSWSDLTAEEWDTMSYRSMNTFGFVGYQFGEALLIDLGYYDDDVYYLNGADTNTWDGTWTGKNGATSLEAFMTKEVQDPAIVDAFGYNLSVIEEQLGAQGRELSEFLGETASYVQNGETVTVELSLTGILAAAHLRGAWAVADLLLSGTLSFDEFGTSILQYVTQFGGYDSPGIDALIKSWEDGKTGDEGLGGPGANPDGDDVGTAGVNADTADVVIDWDWASNTSVEFNPSTDAIFVGWIAADSLEITQTADGVRIAVPQNNQSTTLLGVDLEELSPANFTFLDASAAAEVFALIGEGSGPVDPDPVDPDPIDPDPVDPDPVDPDPVDPDPVDPDPVDPDPVDPDPVDPDPVDPPTAENPGLGTANVTAETADVAIDWDWGRNEEIPFDPASDTVFVGWLTSSHIEVSETANGVVIAVPGNNQTVTLSGISLSDLSPSNFTFRDQSAADEVFALIGEDTTPTDPGGPAPDPDPDPTDGEPVTPNEAVSIGWDWGKEVFLTGFDPAQDQIDFGSLQAGQFEISAAGDGDVVIEVLNNGGHFYRFDAVTASDLAADNFEAPNWNSGAIDYAVDQLDLLA